MGRNAIVTPRTGRRVLARFWPPRFAAAHWTRAKTQERENGAPSAIKSVKLILLGEPVRSLSFLWKGYPRHVGASKETGNELREMRRLCLPVNTQKKPLV